MGARLHDRPHRRGPRPRDQRRGPIRVAATHLRTGAPDARSGARRRLRSGRPFRGLQGGSRARRRVSTVLTVDLGTSTVKVALWREHHLLAFERVPLLTVYPQPGYAEQEPESWWDA